MSEDVKKELIEEKLKTETKLENPQWERFVQEYRVDRNGRQAARRAGYKHEHSHTTASRLLKRPDVQARLKELDNNATVQAGITADRIMAELAVIGFKDINNMGPVKTSDKRQALVDMGKQMGMFKEQVEMTATMTLEQLVEASMEEGLKKGLDRALVKNEDSEETVH